MDKGDVFGDVVYFGVVLGVCESGGIVFDGDDMFLFFWEGKGDCVVVSIVKEVNYGCVLWGGVEMWR